MRSLVVTSLAALTLAACGGAEVADQETPPTKAIATTTTVTLAATTTTMTASTTGIPVEVADAAIAVVVSALAAKNSLDLDGWLMAFEGGKRQGVPLFAEEILMNANQHWEIVEPCQVRGQAASGETIVECLIVNTDDFWGVGNIYEPRGLMFNVNTDGKITTSEGVTNTNTFRSTKRNSFNTAFHRWLSDTYPDVYEDIDPGSTTSSGPGFQTQNAEHMLIAVTYVEEFVAQSDDYPINP